MSEYQYYEFQAIDEPLTAEEQDELADISTRAEITRTSFTNEYHWGDLKADPLDFMKEYFDAHVYVANWGTHRLMLRLPRELVDLKGVKKYQNKTTVDVDTTREHVIISLSTMDDYERDGGFMEAEGWMGSLLPLRDDLIRGDLRSLYIGWLADLDDESDAVEPPVPAGMKELSDALKSLADFLDVEKCLLEAAAEADADGAALTAEPSTEDMSRWVANLPQQDKDGTLLELLTDKQPSTRVVNQFMRRFQVDWRAEHPVPAPTGTKRRTMAQLGERTTQLNEVLEQREQARRRKEELAREKEAAKARKQHLIKLAAREDAAWSEIETLLQTSAAGNYEQAVEQLKDLREVATMRSTTDRWNERIAEIRGRFSRRSALIRRFDAAEFPR